MNTHTTSLLSFSLLSAVFATACGSVEPSDMSGVEDPLRAPLMQCEDCEPPPPPDDPPPPPPPPPCGSNTYSNPSSFDAQKWTPEDARFRATGRYAGKRGFVFAFQNHHYASYPWPTGPVYGTHFLGWDAVAEWRDVPASTLGNPNISDVPSMMRAAQVYATSQGYAAALPSFEQAIQNGQAVKGMFMLRNDAVEFRDVHGCELGYPNLNDSGQMFRGAHDYAIRNGFDVAFPTFFSANYGQGTVYGLILIKPGKSYWEDVRRADLLDDCGGDGQEVCYPGSQCDSGMLYSFGIACFAPSPPPPPPPPEPCGGSGEKCCTTGDVCDDMVNYACVSNFCIQQRGVASLSMSQVTGTPYRYMVSNVSDPVLSNTPVIIEKVENANGYAIQLRHVDTNGAIGIANIAAASGMTPVTDTTFAGMRFAGDWSADIGGQVYPLTTSVRVTWHR